MASFSRLEALLSTIASGITGIGLWKDYGIKTPELRYFLKSLDSMQVSASALAPSPPTRARAIETAYSRLLARLSELEQDDVPEDRLEDALREANELYSLLNAMYTSLRTYAISV